MTACLAQDLRQNGAAAYRQRLSSGEPWGRHRPPNPPGTRASLKLWIKKSWKALSGECSTLFARDRPTRLSPELLSVREWTAAGHKLPWTLDIASFILPSKRAKRATGSCDFTRNNHRLCKGAQPQPWFPWTSRPSGSQPTNVDPSSLLPSLYHYHSQLAWPVLPGLLG